MVLLFAAELVLGGPTLHRGVAEKAMALRPMHSLRFIVSGGAHFHSRCTRDCRQHLGASIGTLWLQRSFTGFHQRVASRSRQIWYMRIPPADTVTIVDKSGDRLAAGQKGEILLRGPTVMSGYLEDPELNRTAFLNGWFRLATLGVWTKMDF